ncbi:hypothetical protein ACFWBV_09125 [Streptomyces sp. NPDC060030]|uniref:hypothetical protein n=1 Tax=Streptomyces sp. NPDC060030 TaxID=3347042 RepID=UPI0036CF8948
MSYASHPVQPDRIPRPPGEAGLEVTAHPPQEPGEGTNRRVATFLARKPGQL